MKIKTLIWIDKTIVYALLFLLNFLVRIIGKILRIDHRLDKDFKTIVICKYKGMGSIIQSTPLAQSLRSKYKNATIYYVSTKANEALLKEIKCIDIIYLIDDSSLFKLLITVPKVLANLISKRVDVYIDLEIYSNFSSLITTLSLAKNRIGFYLRSSNYRLGIYTHMMYYNVRVPISQTYLQMARLLNCEKINSQLYPLHGSFKEIGFYLNTDQNNRNQEYIVINPNASDLRIERRWPAENYVALVNYILQKYTNLYVVLIGAPSEKLYVDGIEKKVNPTLKLLNLAGKTSIKELIGIIENAKLIITNDSGPMHIAFATSTQTLALFGPCDPAQYGNTENCYVLYKKVYCSPCVHEFQIPPCKGNNQCMKLIDNKTVQEAVDHLLNSAIIKNEELNDENVYVANNKYEADILGLITRS